MSGKKPKPVIEPIIDENDYGDLNLDAEIAHLLKEEEEEALNDKNK